METINVTPTWGGVLRMMLEAHRELFDDRSTEEKRKALNDLNQEFIRMAQAADKYNEINQATKYSLWLDSEFVGIIVMNERFQENVKTAIIEHLTCKDADVDKIEMSEERFVESWSGKARIIEDGLEEYEAMIDLHRDAIYF